jgi:hypothetical protein
MNRTFVGLSPGWLNAIRQRAGRLLMALLLAVGGWGTTVPLPAHAAMTALINADTVSGSPSLEEQQAVAAGFTVTVVSGATWTTMTAAQFAAYQLLIIGDRTCSFVPVSATSNAAVWAPVVMGKAGGNTLAGNRVVIGTDPVFHGKPIVIKDGIKFAGALTGRTGLYYDATCGDTVPGQTITTLAQVSIGVGAWTYDGAPPCGGDVSMIASNPAFADLTSLYLRGWGCSVHEAFPTFPSDWLALAIALDTTGHPTCGNDRDTGAAKCGEAYILVAGDVSATAPNICLTPTDATNPVSTNHTVTAHVQSTSSPACPAGPAVSGQLVSFTVTGQNAGAGGTCSPVSCVTDVNGNVSFTYTGGPTAGSDVINASFTSGGTTQTTTAKKTWTAAADTIPPSCALTAVIAGPPAQIVVTVQDADDGLNTITFTATNATVVVDPFVPGTKNPVNITATKVDQTVGATLDVVATDMSGNTTICDPTLVTDGKGKPQLVTIDGSEGKVAIANSGLSSLDITVNGQTFTLSDIASQTNLALDISAALNPGSNVVTLHGKGKNGTSATVVFSS